MRAPTSPPIGAKTKMPLLARGLTRGARRGGGCSAAGHGEGECGRRGLDGPVQRLPPAGRRRERAFQQPPVDAVARMRVLITYDLEAGEGTDPGADQHVSHPVAVVVHAGDAGERGTRVEDRPD